MSKSSECPIPAHPISKHNRPSQTSPTEETAATSGEESTSCLITPPAANISIGHLYVYNFSPSREASTSIEIPISTKRPNKFHSPAASSGPFCRICHEGDNLEDLVSPCRCSGTVGLIHLSCMERWLSLAGSDKCEICNYVFLTLRSPRSFVEWIRNSRSDADTRRSLVSDLMCFLLLTPLAGVSSFLCVEGAKKQVMEGNSLEAGCLMALATFLVTIYFIWNLLTCRYHVKNFLRWRTANQKVKVLRMRRITSDEDEESNVPNSISRAEVVVQIPNEHQQHQAQETSLAHPEIPSNLTETT